MEISGTVQKRWRWVILWNDINQHTETKKKNKNELTNNKKKPLGRTRRSEEKNGQDYKIFRFNSFDNIKKEEKLGFISNRINFLC